MMLIVYDALGFSFRKVANLLDRGFKEIGYVSTHMVDGNTAFHIPKNYKSVLISDFILIIRRGWVWRFKDYTSKLIVWGDTPLSLEHVSDVADKVNDVICNYVVLPYFIKVFKEYGFRVDGFIPRPIDYETASKVFYKARCDDLIKKYGDYVVTVAADQILIPPKLPRKGLDMYDKLCEWLKSKGIKCLAVSNWIHFKNVHRIPFGSLSEYELMRLVKCAKLFVWTSRAEGFGLPPLEAMAVGQVVVASNNPTNELIHGIKFDYSDVKKVYMPEIGYYYHAFDYRFEDLKDAVDYALDLPEDERWRLIMEGRRSAKAFSPRYVSLALGEV